MPQWRQKLKPDTQNKLQLWLPALITLLVKWQGFFFNALPHNHTCKQLWSHVDGSSYYAARHHGFWFTEAQVGDLCPILFVQLEKAKRWLSNQVENTAAIKLLSNIYEISWFNAGQTMPQHLYNHSDNLILCTELTVSSLNTDFRAGMKLCSFFSQFCLLNLGKIKEQTTKNYQTTLQWCC